MRDVSMTPLNFLPVNKVCFCKQTRPTKKPDQTSSGLQFRVIKTISQKIYSPLRANESLPQKQNYIVIKTMATSAKQTPSHCPRVRRSLRNIHASMTVTPEKRELNTEATS